MRKGQVIGPAADRPEGPSRRGMLPPTGAGPIEVTREEPTPTAEEGDTTQDAADIGEAAASTVVPLQASTPGDIAMSARAFVSQEVCDALTAELPEETEDAETVIEACEKRLRAAGTLLDAVQARAQQAYFHYAGPAVRLAWTTESWRTAVDPATGNPCRSWSAWLRVQGVSRQHAYRMTKEQPIREALKGVHDGPLGVRQLDVLSPVLNSHGAQGVRELWVAALGWGDTSPAALLKLRRERGLEPDRLVSEGQETPVPSQAAPLLRFQTRPGSFDAARVREVTRSQPEIALLIAKEILAELGVEADLKPGAEPQGAQGQ